MESDLRPGGKWMMRGIGMGKKAFIVAGEYRQIERPRLLVFTWLRLKAPAQRIEAGLKSWVGCRITSSSRSKADPYRSIFAVLSCLVG
jgi:uncharacterized protein YndB with AHSA1/START domain